MVKTNKNTKLNTIFISSLTLLTSIFTSNKSFAQIFDNTQVHPKQKWLEITTSKFNLLLPEEQKKRASTLTQELYKSILFSEKDFEKPTRKITFIFQNQTTDANGFVQLAPRKSELYANPDASPDNQSWIPNLFTHESRHVAQFDNMTGFFRAPFLEQLGLAIYGLTLPSWYFEGDAVLHETLFADGGRGKLSSFEMPIRANILSEKPFTYEKYLLGSYKDIVPSYYSIGYMMTATLKNNVAPNFEKTFYNRLKKHLLLPYNFSNSMQHISGFSGSKLFKKTITEFGDNWQKNQRRYQPESYQSIPEKPHKYYANYYQPKVINDQIYTIENKPTITPQLVRIDSKTEKKEVLFKTGKQPYAHFDIKANQIIWDENRIDKRFTKAGFNVFNLFDITHHKTSTLPLKGKIYTPSFHPLTSEITYIEIDVKGDFWLKTYDVNHKTTTNVIAAPENTQLQHPSYNSDGSKIICIALLKNGTQLIEADLKSKTWTNVTEISSLQYERPQYISENNIIFKSNYNGLDNIYQLNTKQKTLSLLTKAPFGAFNPYFDQKTKTLWFNNYDPNGYKISFSRLENVPPVAPDENYFYAAYKPLATTLDVEKIYQEASKDSISFQIKPYRGINRTLNFHSLSLSPTDYSSFDNIKSGIFWLSNNLLNTTQVKLGYEYDADKRSGEYLAGINYNKYFPKISVNYENRAQLSSAAVPKKPDSTVNISWREHYISTQVSIPFVFNKQNTAYNMGLNLATAYLKRYDLNRNDLKNFNKETLFPMTYQLYLGKNERLAKMDLAQRWGQNMSITYRHFPFEKDVKGEVLSIRTNFFFPGILTNHSFQIRASAQQASGNYRYLNDIPLITAFGYFKYEKVKNTVLMNYRFPIAYPDWALGGITYIKRLKGGLFADYQNINLQKQAAPKSFGASLAVDFNAFRFPLPDFEASIKVAYLNHSTASQSFVPFFSLNYSY